MSLMETKHFTCTRNYINHMIGKHQTRIQHNVKISKYIHPTQDSLTYIVMKIIINLSPSELFIALLISRSFYLHQEAKKFRLTNDRTHHSRRKQQK